MNREIQFILVFHISGCFKDLDSEYLEYSDQWHEGQALENSHP